MKSGKSTKTVKTPPPPKRTRSALAKPPTPTPKPKTVDKVSLPTIPKPSRQPRPLAVKVPPLLLEPDHLPSEEPLHAGPGARFLPVSQSEKPAAPPPTELPESYGTQQIFLAARDPYWILASWDLDPSQQSRYNAQSSIGAVTIRLRRGHADGPIHLEVHTKPDSKDWFINAASPDTTFVAELGFHQKNSGNWKRISVSKSVTTPRDRAIAPPPPPAPIQHAPSPSIPEPSQPRITEAPVPAPIAFATPRQQFPQREEIRATELPVTLGHGPSRWEPAATPAWTPAQAKALDELISLELKRTQQGSIEIEELLRRHIGRPEADQSKAEQTSPSSMELQITPEQLLGLAQPGGPSSAEFGPAPHRKGFWFKVNAELIIYGSTEPNAHVSIGGRPIRLREDGSFSFRFALPDGAYELPVIALSQNGDDGRAAELRFSRFTHYSGEVGAHAQDSSLKSPSVANL